MFSTILKKISPKNKKHYLNGWMAGSFIVCLTIAFPLIIIFSHLIIPGDEAWQHITNNLLSGYIANTLILLVAVAVLVVITGISTAWMVSMYNFPGSEIIQWLLVLPLTIPPYILGFTWVGMLDYTSPAYVFLRNTFGFETGQFLFFNILSLPGAIIIFSLSLYPYVFLISQTWFSRQSKSILEAGYSLGHRPLSVFLKIALPLSRPALIAGLSLALMEVLNDYGLVSYFGVDTFTTGIFTAWFSFASSGSATKLSGYLMIIVLIVFLIERLNRGKRKYHTINSNYKPIRKKELKGIKGALATLLTSIPVLLGFILPVAMLIYWTIQTGNIVLSYRFLPSLRHSIILASLSSILVIILAVIISYTERIIPTKFAAFMARFATIGYVIPGAIIAIGLFIPFTWLDNKISTVTGGSARIILTGSSAILIFAYTVRFMAIGYNSTEAAMDGLSKSLDEASVSLGKTRFKTLQKIVIPVIYQGILAGGLLVFIDVLKELPLTLILRPFNFDTLAIRAFEYASDERIQEAAPASFVIILIGILIIGLISKILKTQNYVNHTKDN